MQPQQPTPQTVVVAGSLERCQEIAASKELEYWLPVVDVASVLRIDGTEPVLIDHASLDEISLAERFLIYEYLRHLKMNEYNGFSKRMMNPERAHTFVHNLEWWMNSGRAWPGA